jgi:multidrug resistance protein, MATE family
MWNYEDDDNASWEEHGYSGYESDAIDPSPWALIGTVGICAFLILLLPLFVALRQQYRRKKRRRRGKKDTATVSTTTSKESSTSTANNANETKEVTPENVTTDEEIARLYGQEVTMAEPSTTRWNRSSPAFCGVDNAFFIMDDMIFDDDGSDDNSVYGLSKEQPINKPDIAEPEMDHLPTMRRWGGSRSKGLARLLLQPFGGLPEAPVVVEPQEQETAVPQNKDKPVESAFRFIGFGDDNHIEVVRSSKDVLEEDLLGTDVGSVDNRDFLTQLLDEFNLGDDDESVVSTDQSSPSSDEQEAAANVYINMDGLVPGNEKENDFGNKYDIDLCCGSRPWYGYYLSSGFLRKVWKCASWDDEMKRIVRLAIPYTTYALVTGVFGLMEVAVIGQIFAKYDSSILGSYYAVQFILSLSTMFLNGAINSLPVLCSHAVGAGNFTLAGKYCQIALVLYQMVFLPITAICWNRIDDVVMRLGYDENVAEEAQSYGRLSFLTVAVSVMDWCIHYMLDVCGFEWYSSIMYILHGLTSLVAVFVVGMCVSDAKLWMVGAVHVFLAAFFCYLNVLIVTQKNWLSGFWGGFRSINYGGVHAVRVFFKTAIPLSIGYTIEYCEWEILFLFAAFQGPAEVAVWGLMGNIWGLGEMVSQAVADASEVRVAKLVGSHFPALARYSSHKSLLLGVMLSVFMSALLLALHIQLPKWLTKDEVLQHMISNLLPLVCVGLCALTLGSTSWTIICAQGRARLATTVTLVGSMCISLPLAFVSTFALHWNLQGLLASVVVGYALSGIINSFIMVTSNWERISSKVTRRNANENGRNDAEIPSVSDDTRSSSKVLEQSSKVKADASVKGVTVKDDASESPAGRYYAYHWDELPKEGGICPIVRDVFQSYVENCNIVSICLPSLNFQSKKPPRFLVTANAIGAAICLPSLRITIGRSCRRSSKMQPMCWDTRKKSGTVRR